MRLHGVLFVAAFHVAICRPGSGRCLPSAPSHDDDVLSVVGCVYRAGNLTALSGMTGLTYLDLSNNRLAGAPLLRFVYCRIPCRCSVARVVLIVAVGFVCRAGNLIALSNMTGMTYLDLDMNLLSGVPLFDFLCHCTPHSCMLTKSGSCLPVAFNS